MVFSANDLLEWKDFPKGLRVLLLDQDANSASDIKSKLQQMEYIVSAFFSEHEAISAISSKSEIFHVAIVEVNTRNSDDRYKFIESTKDVPTIMTSDEYCLSTMMRCIALGAVEFLIKPLSEDKLRNIWQHVVHKAFKAGGNESTETIAEFVGSVLDIQQQNLASHNQVPKEVKEESEMNQIQHHHESNLNDKFPAPSTPQLKQGGRIFDDQDSQEQTNVSPIKDSQDQASDGSPIKDCKDQTNDSPAQVCRDQTNGSPVIDFQDQTNDSPVKHCQDQTNGSPVTDFQDQTNGSPVKHCQDQTNGSLVINFQDQTNGSSVKDCQDQTNGSSIIDFQDQTNGSLVKDCQDQTNGSPIIDFQDQTNGSPVKDCQDQTTVSPVIDFQDQTNGPPVKDYQDQTNGSPVIDFQDQTNGSPVKDCQDQTNGSVKDFQDQTNGSAVKDRQDQTNGSPISDSGEFDKEAKSADNTCSDSVTKMEIDPPQVVTEIVIKDEGGCDHGSERMHECDLSSKRQNGDQMDIIDSPGTMEKSNKAFTPQNANGAKGNRKKVKVDWTPELHKKFVQAVEKLGVDQAIPSRILELMKVEGLTRHNVASHLQKYRMHRRHILPKDNSRRWPHPRDNRPIMAFPPYHTNHNLPPGQVYPTWGQPPHFSVWGPPNYLWQPVETWQWKHTYTRVHADAWGCPVLPPPPSYPQPSTTFPDQVHGAYGFHNQNYADPNPGEEIIDKVVKEAMNKPWLPLPIGLNPPSTDSVLAELSRQGISAIPSHINGHHSC